MIFENRLFRFYIHSNIHVSLTVYCMVTLTGLYFDIDTSDTASFMGLSAFMAYNWIRYLKFKGNSLRPDIYFWFDNNKNWLFILCSVVLVYLITMLSIFDLHWYLSLLPFLLITFLYMVPIELLKDNYSLRKIPGIKIFLISVSWSGLVVLLPFIHNNVIIGIRELLFFLHQFLFVFVLTLPFDMRDVTSDNKELHTIPQVLGIDKSKALGGVMLLACSVITYVLFEGILLCSMIGISFITGVLLLKSTTNQSKYYSSFWVEGIPILWFICLRFLGGM